MEPSTLAEIHHHGGSRPDGRLFPSLVFNRLRVGETHALQLHVSSIRNEQKVGKI